jgi:hypothetical protein
MKSVEVADDIEEQRGSRIGGRTRRLRGFKRILFVFITFLPFIILTVSAKFLAGQAEGSEAAKVFGDALLKTALAAAGLPLVEALNVNGTSV